ncbi:NAD(P)/FAD-dependent oxidoreductase [Actinomadura sp. 6N118]|uniref:NAD(P)/FAD-dependent oxidoreductase n=1 Tax=Actinomadura sp. 6N118 TaxID=3375151 RepID=UPI0037BB3646
MSHIVVIGGGFAGVWSAAAAANVRATAASSATADLRITLIAPNEDLVLRPYLHQADPDRARVPLKRFLGPIDVDHLRGVVTGIDAEHRRLTLDDGRAVGYDRLILATGSHLVRPDFPGAERMFDVDTLEAARRLDVYLRTRSPFRAVVVGAGFTGLEVATELAERGEVVLIDRDKVVGPELGPGPRPQIEAALDEVGVERRLGVTVTEVGDGYVRLSDGTRLDTDAVVWTAGMQASPLTAQVGGVRDRLGRLEVDAALRVSGEIFAAGDTAAARVESGQVAVQSCQYATPLGKTAGHNAAADLLGLPLKDFAPSPYVTCLDLGAAGAIYTQGWNREVQAAGAEGKAIKKMILDVIRPPMDDPEAIFAAATQVRTR